MRRGPSLLLASLVASWLALAAPAAALELTPSQSEVIAQSSMRGEITLALRSIADIGEAQTTTEDKSKDRANAIRVLRYGVRAKAYGVQ